MNDLSWMLYLADISGNIGVAGGVVTFAASIAGVATFAYVSGHIDIDNIGSKEKRPVARSGWQASKGFFIAAIVAALVTIPIPSRDTIYAIAASEMGERALKTPIATKAGKALEKWLDDQIADEPKESSK